MAEHHLIAHTEFDDVDSDSEPNVVPCEGTPLAVPPTLRVAANDDPDMAEKPIIRIEPGAMKINIEAATRELGRTGRHYQAGGRIVGLLHKTGTSDVEIQEATPNTLLRDLDAIIHWQRLNRRTQEWITCEPHSKYIRTMLEAGQHLGVPVLTGVSRQPHVRRDGSVCVSSGYDAETGIYGAFDSANYSVPTKATRTEALVALGTLIDVLEEFPFVRACDPSAAVAAMITAAMRPTLPTAPMFHIKAAQIASGKSYLCAVISAFATPKKGNPASFPASNEECRKVLLAQLRKSPPVIEFDNITADITAHQALCTMLTSEQMEDRVLGKSETQKVSTRALVLSSGNNVNPSKDMRRRCVTIELDPGVEIPAARLFKRQNLLAEITANRGRYVSAALTVVSAWVAAGRPRQGLKPLGSYNEWSDYCREPLVWLGLDDPATAVFEALADDPDRSLLGQAIDAIEANFGRKAVMVKEMVSRTQASGTAAEELHDVFQEITGDAGAINRKRLGHWLAKHEGQIVDGRKIVRASAKRNSQAWQVAHVSGAVPKSTKESTECPSLRGETVSVQGERESVLSVSSVQSDTHANDTETRVSGADSDSSPEVANGLTVESDFELEFDEEIIEE